MSSIEDRKNVSASLGDEPVNSNSSTSSTFPVMRPNLTRHKNFMDIKIHLVTVMATNEEKEDDR